METEIVIDIKDIVKVYSMGQVTATALAGVTLEVYQNEFVAIMGASGSGKSTLMNIIGCLDKPTSGIYTLDGRNVSDLNDRELAEIRNKKIGFVFQSFNLLPKLTSFENVELPMCYAGAKRRIRREKVETALEKVGLKDRMSHKPNELSGGQRQRVAIARALVNEPAILLADEPTGNLDSHSTEEIMAIFQQLNDEGATIVIVTHEKDVAEHTKRIVTFRDGIIIGDSVVENRIFARSEN